MLCTTPRLLNRLRIVAGACAALLTVGCGGVGGAASLATPYSPRINPAEFTTAINNPYFPLVPGTRFVYDGTTTEGRERTVTEVTRETKKVMGVDTVVVHDTVTGDGRLIEDTYDWYAQDRAGNVWYFGEDTRAIGAGGTVSTAGSWQAGVDGALPGIVMLAHPRVGETYRQEYYPGVAEDTGEVVSTTGTASVAAGTFQEVLTTKDVNPLEGTAEHKLYARDVGFILLRPASGPAEHVELAAIEKF
jgi:hypothetical protein